MKAILGWLCMTVFLISSAGLSHARELEGVRFEDSAMVAGQRLVLSGAGVRKKFVIKVYVAGLYLAEKATDSERILAMPGPKRVEMRFLYKEVEAAKIASAWTEGMRNNLSSAEFDAIRPRLDAFNRLFPAMRRGDSAVIDYSAEAGVRVSINGREAGGVEGEDFMRALLQVWFGKRPVDSGLKEGLLGK